MSLFESIFSKIPSKEDKRKSIKKEIPSTAGAIPVKNAKGQITMERVKVKRYVAGKLPDYINQESKDANHEILLKESEYESEVLPQQNERPKNDHGRRIIFEPQIIHAPDKDKLDQNVEAYNKITGNEPKEHPESEEDEDANIMKRKLLKQQLLKKEQENVFTKLPSAPVKEDEEVSEEEYESSEESESENEALPRLKPIFVPKGERVTIAEDTEIVDKIAEEKELELANKRRQETIEIVSGLIKEEAIKEQVVEGHEDVVFTDDEDEETAFEMWKVRELKRIKREVEEAESREAEKREIERLHMMTEEERTAALAANPKIITNQSIKGEYKFLQKYYHRGAFYLDVDDDVYKRNFAEPTLEDHFDKLVLPKVMQVKKFGVAGRTKYTHLVDQDTSSFDGAWSKKNELAGEFAAKIGGGMKQKFERPSNKRKDK